MVMLNFNYIEIQKGKSKVLGKTQGFYIWNPFFANIVG